MDCVAAKSLTQQEASAPSEFALEESDALWCFLRKTLWRRNLSHWLRYA
jgi:hypothetical protein